MVIMFLTNSWFYRAKATMEDVSRFYSAQSSFEALLMEYKLKG